MRVEADSIDPIYSRPYVEIDEMRTEPEPHRYVHGGFRGSEARFSFYFPPAGRYQGRFFHNTYPLATSADIGPFPIAFNVATGNLGFTIDSGAYYVQTNNGGVFRDPGTDPSLPAYRANAAAAKYSRVVAAEIYGKHRPFGYLFGGSGGAYQTMGAAQNTIGVWDGFVPFVPGSDHAVPNNFSVRMHALRVLRQRNKFPAILDAIDPGGNQDPYAGLNQEESATFREATLMGFPPRGWYNHEVLGSGYFAGIAPLLPVIDPDYAEHFWNKPGYLGSDPESSIRSERVRFVTTIAKIAHGFPRLIELTNAPDKNPGSAHLVVLSGAAAGQSLSIGTINGNTLGFRSPSDAAVLDDCRPGDQVRIDNSWPLALQTIHRHQVPPTSDYIGWNQFRDAAGRPAYPQREVYVGLNFTVNCAGCTIDGRIHGKVLALSALMDIDAFAWQGDWYRSKVKSAMGSKFHDNFALWFIDHAQHDDPLTDFARAHAVSYGGALQQALRDMSQWVEKGVRPAEMTYQVVDSQVIPARAAARKGVQAVIELRANGGVRADVDVGEPVAFTAAIEVPPGMGKVVAVEWDFEGLGTYPVVEAIGTPQDRICLAATHAYSTPGTYFCVIRGTSQREGDTRTPYGRIQNIGRVRVVVT